MKKILSIALALCLLCGLSATAFAEHLTGSDDWMVTYNSNGDLKANFKASGYSDPIGDLQPGDDITLTINLVNNNMDETDWYLSNEVLTSLEESSSEASGGAYEYVLTFSGPSGDKTIYESHTIGGDDSEEGLKEATNALDNEDMQFLDTLMTGETATVTLVVTLDGETQGNGYQSTLADLQMNFAVEVQEDEGPTIVKTGDEAKLFPYYIAMAVSGVLFLALAVYSLNKRKKSREGNAQ